MSTFVDRLMRGWRNYAPALASQVPKLPTPPVDTLAPPGHRSFRCEVALAMHGLSLGASAVEPWNRGVLLERLQRDAAQSKRRRRIDDLLHRLLRAPREDAQRVLAKILLEPCPDLVELITTLLRSEVLPKQDIEDAGVMRRAAADGSPVTVRALLDLGFSPEPRHAHLSQLPGEGYRRPPLEIATSAGSVAVVRELSLAIAHGRQTSGDFWSFTYMLETAFNADRLAVVHFYYEHGVRLDHWYSLIDHAVERDRVRLLSYWLSVHAGRRWYYQVDPRKRLGECLHTACSGDMVRLLIQHGAATDTLVGGKTPLATHAQDAEHGAQVKQLLCAGGNLDALEDTPFALLRDDATLRGIAMSSQAVSALCAYLEATGAQPYEPVTLLRVCLLEPDDLVAFMVQLFHRPMLARTIIPKILFLKSMDIRDGGKGVATWAPVARALFTCMQPMASYSGPRALRRIWEDAHIGIDAMHPHKHLHLPRRDWTLLTVQGRTIFFAVMTAAGRRVRAVKVRKSDERLTELFTQKITVDFLNQHRKALGLQSDLPQSYDVVTCDGLAECLGSATPALVATFAQLVGDTAGPHYAYVYDIPSVGYMTYVHSIADPAQFLRSMRLSVHDQFTLLRHGFAQIVADLYHNTGDERTYEACIDLFREEPLGSGRVSGWRQGVAYPNMVQTGIRDEVLKTTQDKMGGRMYHDGRWADFTDYTQRWVHRLANAMGNYLFASALIVGRRALDEGRADSWHHAADMLRRLHALAISAYVGIPESLANRFTSASIDWPRCARQMSVWMTADYVEPLKQGRVVDGLYDIDVTVGDVNAFRGWHPTLGYAINGKDADIGTVNGQCELKEMEKANYLTAMTAIMLQRAAYRAEELGREARAAQAYCAPAEAMALYERAVAVWPYARGHWLTLGQLHAAAGNAERARACREEAAALLIQQRWRARAEEA